MTKVAIVDYGLGNLRSVRRGIERTGVRTVITSNHDTISSADGIVLPGVGAFRQGMEMLDTLKPTISECAERLPVLGICLGMQMLMEWSEERGFHKGLGLIPGIVKRFPHNGIQKVPHMGWNTIHRERDDPLLEGLGTDEFVYFVHSYYARTLTEYSLTSTEYICLFTSTIGHGHIYGVQFHPEKSGSTGLNLLENFVAML